MSTYWVSWWHTQAMSAWELHFPWWRSGFRHDADSMCAAVSAEDEDAVRRMIRRAYDVPPVDIEFRFLELRESSPYSDRFGKADWMPDWPFSPEVSAKQAAITDRVIVPGTTIPYVFDQTDDRTELRQMLDCNNVAVTDAEFEALFLVQSAMRGLHGLYADQTDKTITPEQFLELSERNASLGFQGFKAILGADRYHAVFGTDETENLLPIDRDVFLAENAEGGSHEPPS